MSLRRGREERERGNGREEEKKERKKECKEETNPVDCVVCLNFQLESPMSMQDD